MAVPSGSKLPDGCRPLAVDDDGVYGIYTLREPPTNPTLDIVFFHGLQPKGTEGVGSWWSTWQRDSNDPWPLDLPEECRLLSVSWDSRAFTKGGVHAPMSWDNTAETIATNLCLSTVVSTAPRMLLVGHSMGGLMIKKVVELLFDRKHAAPTPEERDSAAQVLGKVCGFVFFSTPHHGAWAATAADAAPGFALKWLAWAAIGEKEPTGDLLRRLRILNTDTAVLNDKFERWRNSELRNVPILCFFETKPIQVGSACHQVVEQAAATLLGHAKYPVNADHYTVCKLTKESATFQKFREFAEITNTPVRELPNDIELL